VVFIDSLMLWIYALLKVRSSTACMIGSLRVHKVYYSMLVKYIVCPGCDVVRKYVAVGIVSGGSNESWMCGGV
jgi:hypothetical protein